ncbi:MAG TPA: protein kinase [Rugosimonospora sp.]|nr:protein kinase [Rugosimonospora sp.]
MSTVVAQQVLGGRYRLRNALGRGGMATVWRADDLRFDREVAVKQLAPGTLTDPQTRARLSREAQILSGLAHPNIVTVHDVHVDADGAYLVMELAPGSTLARLLSRGRPPVPWTISVAAQVCDALAAAHRAGVLHRDIKPGNLMVSPEGRVKVCDFGLARSPDTHTLTDVMQVVGTSEYLAPERAEGERGDARSDLYALGCVLYEMLTGNPPFTGRNPIAVAYQQVHNAPRAPASVRSDIPPELDRLVLDLLAKDPAARPATAAEVGARLAALLPRAAPTPPPPPRPAPDPDQTQLLAPVPAQGRGAGQGSLWRSWSAPAPRSGRRLRWLVIALIGLILITGAVIVSLLSASSAPAGPDPGSHCPPHAQNGAPPGCPP